MSMTPEFKSWRTLESQPDVNNLIDKFRAKYREFGNLDFKKLVADGLLKSTRSLENNGIIALT